MLLVWQNLTRIDQCTVMWLHLLPLTLSSPLSAKCYPKTTVKDLLYALTSNLAMEDIEPKQNKRKQSSTQFLSVAWLCNKICQCGHPSQIILGFYKGIKWLSQIHIPTNSLLFTQKQFTFSAWSTLMLFYWVHQLLLQLHNDRFAHTQAASACPPSFEDKGAIKCKLRPRRFHTARLCLSSPTCQRASVKCLKISKIIAYKSSNCQNRIKSFPSRPPPKGNDTLFCRTATSHQQISLDQESLDTTFWIQEAELSHDVW